MLALVAVCALVVAVRTLARDVSVGEELLCLLVIILLCGLLYQFAVVIQLLEEVRSHLVVSLRCGAAVDVERDAELLEALLYHRVISVNDILRRDAFLLCAYGDRHSVLVASSDEYHVFVFQAQVAHVYVGRHIYSGQVSDVHTAVGIRQGGGYGCTFEFLLFHYYDVLYFLSKCEKPACPVCVVTCAYNGGAIVCEAVLFMGLRRSKHLIIV